MFINSQIKIHGLAKGRSCSYHGGSYQLVQQRNSQLSNILGQNILGQETESNLCVGVLRM